MPEPASGDADEGSALARLLRPPRRHGTFGVLAGSAFLMAVLWYFGTDVGHATAIGAALGVAGGVWVALPTDDSADWPPEAPTRREGTRDDIRQLSVSLRGGYSAVPALRRLKELAEPRLAARHLDLSDPGDQPEIERLIGSAALATLHHDSARSPSLGSVVHCLDMLDVLDPDGAAPPSTLPTRTFPLADLLRDLLRRAR